MRVELKNFTRQASGVKHFDLHEDFGLAYLVEDGQTTTLYLNDRRCQSWPNGVYPEIFQIKWFDQEHVIMERAKTSGAIISTESLEEVELGLIYGLLLSQGYIFVTYTEEAGYSSREGELERNFLSVFSRDGRFEFGRIFSTRIATRIHSARSVLDIHSTIISRPSTMTPIFYGYSTP